jgi:hypothetical protein
MMRLRPAFWFSFVVAQALYLAIVLWSLPQIATSADGLPPFDMQPMGYGFDMAQNFLRALPDAGRDFYLGTQHLLDTAYPAALGLMFVLGFSALFRGWVRSVLCVAALAVVCFDYLENAAVTDLLVAGPERVTTEMVALASRWTVLKSIGTAICYLALIAGGLSALVAMWSKKSS